jgi:hypothetical protein
MLQIAQTGHESCFMGAPIGVDRPCSFHAVPRCRRISLLPMVARVISMTGLHCTALHQSGIIPEWTYITTHGDACIGTDGDELRRGLCVLLFCNCHYSTSLENPPGSEKEGEQSFLTIGTKRSSNKLKPANVSNMQIVSANTARTGPIHVNRCTHETTSPITCLRVLQNL